MEKGLNIHVEIDHLLNYTPCTFESLATFRRRITPSLISAIVSLADEVFLLSDEAGTTVPMDSNAMTPTTRIKAIVFNY